ncbi:MAG: tRNA (adenosine(37)-N6)-threonylcarbamoyltransferase complex ATPase subunit type 1 TsaE [Oscillospiraceae bacterium]|nr:tRNA (adenosine(37)-N6)-threonylcarbamoyltransferase complex ATPase subunit type 1 TsaE [Oscillospiraceae bacterium]
MPVFLSNSLADTQKIATDLAKTLKGGEVLAFFGGLGMGKTAMIKSIAAAMGNPSDVSSPTFAIVNDYGGSPRLYHFDMYRVETWDDLYSTGFFEYLHENAILLIEWSENIESALPEGAITIELSPGEQENGRIIKINERGTGA